MPHPLPVLPTLPGPLGVGGRVGGAVPTGGRTRTRRRRQFLLAAPGGDPDPGDAVQPRRQAVVEALTKLLGPPRLPGAASSRRIVIGRKPELE